MLRDHVKREYILVPVNISKNTSSKFLFNPSVFLKLRDIILTEYGGYFFVRENWLPLKC